MTSPATEHSCRRCLLSSRVPGADLDERGICRACREWQPRDASAEENARRQRERDLERTLADVRGGGGEYDCIVSFSGGKDSVWMLHRLVEHYGLRVLAYTSNFDIPPYARDNIRRTLDVLDVDHLEYTPPRDLYKRFIRHLLLHPNSRGAVDTVCYFWLDLREGDLLRLAVDKKVPLVLAGYSPGQPDPERMFYEMSPDRITQRDWTPHELFERGVLHESERPRFWAPRRDLPAGASAPRFLAPLHAWRYDQAEVMSDVVQLGLVKNRLHASPVLSNFTLNWLFMYNDLHSLGYNPYLPEFAQLIREGKANKRAWRIQFALVNWMLRHRVGLGRNVDRGLAWLGLDERELACHRGGPLPRRRLITPSLRAALSRSSQ